MKLNLPQEKVIESLLTTESVTIIGVLLAVIGLLIFWILKQDKKIDERDAYIRLQDKETLQILSELTNNLKDDKELRRQVKEGVSEIKDTTTSNNSILDSLNKMILTKLLNMN